MGICKIWLILYVENMIRMSQDSSFQTLPRSTITSNESREYSTLPFSSRRSGSKKQRTFKKINKEDCDMWALINDKTGLVIFLSYLKKERDMDRLVVWYMLTLSLHVHPCTQNVFYGTTWFHFVFFHCIHSLSSN